jgi:hypothetical protein
MKLGSILGIIFLLSGCDQPAIPTAAAPAQAPVAKAWDLTPQESASCVQYGTVAGNLATDRDNGVPLSQQLATIREKFTGTSAKEFVDMASAVYENPVFNKQTPKSEAMSWVMDCDMRIGKIKAGAKHSNTPAEIAAALADFKTFDGSPLVELFGKYGIKISYVEAVPAEFFEPIPHEKGELVYQLMFSRGATKPMPCHLRDWFKVQMLPMPEVIRRGDEFPHIRPDEDDAAIYWAATGKCSEAY